jgi:hypothetical protein
MQSLYLERGNVLGRKLLLWYAFQGQVITGSNAGQIGQPTGTSLQGSTATTTVKFSLARQSVDLLIGTFITIPDNNRPFVCRYETDPNIVPASDHRSNAGKGACFKRPGDIVQDYRFSITRLLFRRSELVKTWRSCMRCFRWGLRRKLLREPRLALIRWRNGMIATGLRLST